jgi:alpha-tubulin suppressor-like RCC1 family protein
MQLGHNDSQVRHQPQPVMLMLKHFIVQVACGSYHTLCLTREGAIWGFGKNRNGQIGAVGTLIRLLYYKSRVY